MTLFAVNNGYFDDIEVKNALAVEKALREFVKTKHARAGRSASRRPRTCRKDDEAALHELRSRTSRRSGAY